MSTKAAMEASTAASELRDAMSHWPTGVCVVTTVSAGGMPQGATVNSFTSVSLDPGVVSVWLGVTSSTGRAVQESGSLAIHVLAAEQAGLADHFARSARDKFVDLVWDHGKAGQPLLKEGFVARFECTARQMIPVADHLLVLGDVTAIAMGPGVPLLRVHHGYRSAV